MNTTRILFFATLALSVVVGAESIAITAIQTDLVSQYGILDLQANGGINPNTGLPWQAGDQYRLAFHTRDGISAESNDLSVYDAFATAQAQQNPLLASSFGWKALVTVNLNPNLPERVSNGSGGSFLNPDMPLSNPRVHSGTDDQSGGSQQGGAGVPVYAMDGTTAIARNNADIWNGWSNPFEDSFGVVNPLGMGDNPQRLLPGTGPTPAEQMIHYSPFLDQFGMQTETPDNVHGKSVWTGGNLSGEPFNPLGTSLPTPFDRSRAVWGSSNANNSLRVWTRFQSNLISERSLYVISQPLTVTQIPEPTSISILGVGVGLLVLYRRRNSK